MVQEQSKRPTWSDERTLEFSMPISRAWPMRSRSASLPIVLIISTVLVACTTVENMYGCVGHNLLTNARSESSCATQAILVRVSSDNAMRASVYPVGVSLRATPDIESRVVIRTNIGDTLTSKDFSSPRGMNGYYVVNAQWSPDSQYFVFSTTSSGGHSPWSFPMWVYGRKSNVIAKLSDMMNGLPTLSGEFRFSGPNTLEVTTWRQQGALDDRVMQTVNLDDAFARLPPPTQ